MKKQKNGIGISFVFWILVSISLFFCSLFQQQKENEKPVDLNTITLDASCLNTRVDGKIMANYGAFAEEYETTLGIRTSDKSEKLYYIIPVGETGQFIAYLTTGENYDDMSQLLVDTIDYNASKISSIKGVEAKGRMHQMSKNTKKYMVQYFQETNLLGTTDQDTIKKYISPYVLEYESSLMIRPAMIVAGVILLLDVAWLFLPRSFGKKKKEEIAIEKEEKHSNITPEEAFKEVMRQKREQDEETLHQIEMYLGPLTETTQNQLGQEKKKVQDKIEKETNGDVVETVEEEVEVTRVEETIAQKKMKEPQLEQIKVNLKKKSSK